MKRSLHRLSPSERSYSLMRSYVVFAAFCLLTGTLEMKIFLPMCMFALAALAGVNVPVFVKKKKIFDGVIAGICTVICFVTGVIILMFG